MEEQIREFARMIKECGNIVFFGGAGVSTESGVKDYRSRDGLYNTVKEYGVSPEEILSHSFFFEHTDIFYDFYRKYFITDALPNDAHKALAKLEKCGKVKAVITQNIDGLHQKAGSKNVFELHGTASEFYCTECKRRVDGAIDQIKAGKIPKCAHCGGLAKPKVVLYQEMLDEDVIRKSVEYIANADMLIVGGTSLAVSPANTFVRYFNGKYVVIVNMSATDYDKNADLIIRESIGKTFAETMKILEI